MKILMMTPLWGRPEIVKLFVERMEATMPSYCELLPFFILSPNDPCLNGLDRLIDGYEFTVAENQPLGRKKNLGLTDALRLEWDYYMDMGSDDVWTSLLWDIYEPYFKEKYPFFGLKSLYVYNSLTDEAKWVEEYNIDKTDTLTAIGPGRCIRRDVLEQALPLWRNESHFGQDGYSSARIFWQTENRAEMIDNKRLPVVCDIKSSTCLTGWHEFDDLGEPVDVAWVKEVFHINPLAFKNLKNFDKFHDAVLKVSYETRTRKEAFEKVNDMHEAQTGEKRYMNYESYKTAVSKNFKRDDR